MNIIREEFYYMRDENMYLRKYSDKLIKNSKLQSKYIEELELTKADS
jgi:hypothetical protein